MTPRNESELERPPRSMVPRIFGLLALAVLAIAFAGALFGSLRNGQWKDGEEKGEVARQELDRLGAILARARELLAERSELRARLAEAPESELRITQLANLVERADERPIPPVPPRGRVPSGEELDELALWLDGLYRRIAAARDVESRIPDLEAELASLRALAAGAGG